MRQAHSSLMVAGLLMAPVLSISSCSFPDYAFPRLEPGAGAGAVAGDASAVGGGGGADSGAGGSAGGSAGNPNGGSPSGGAGAGTTGGDGGEGGSPRVPNKCADLVDFVAADCTCADDSTHAYVFCSMTRPFINAAAQCSFMDAHLVKIEGVLENTFVGTTASSISMPASVQYFWIGASTQNSPGIWHWVDDEVFWTGGSTGTPTAGKYYNWRTDRPQNTATQACAYMDLDRGWQDGDCTQNRPYVCEAN